MAKISTYPSADNPLLLSDRLIGTEAIRPVPSPTPLATKNFSLGELLQLFSSNFPAASLQAVLNTGNTATQNINLIGTIDVTLIKPDNIEDAAGSQGATFQYLSKGASSINWVDLPVDNLQSVLNSGNTATQNITLVGNISTTKVIPGDIQDQTGNIGTIGQLLSKTSTGIRWISSTPTPPPALADVLFMGNTATNNINLIGDVTATRFIKTGGTSLQYLMADGSVTIADSSVPTLQQVTTEGNTTSNPIEINNINFATALNIIFSDEANGVIINTNTGYGSGTPFALVDEFANTIFAVSHNAVVFANSFVKSGGTGLEYLMADGSITTGMGITAINSLTGTVQTLTVGTTGTDFAIVDSGIDHKFNLPSASDTARGLVTTGTQTLAGAKTFSTAPILSSLTASKLLATDASKNIQTLDTATYPSLTELSYSKGVISPIQTQLNSTVKVIINEFPNTSVTGFTAVEATLAIITIPANTFASSSLPNIKIRMLKQNDAGTSTIRLKTSTSISGVATATVIGLYQMAIAVDVVTLVRNPVINSGFLRVAAGTSTFLSDESTIGGTETSVAFNPAITNYFFITAENTTALDTTTVTTLRAVKIIN